MRLGCEDPGAHLAGCRANFHPPPSPCPPSLRPPPWRCLPLRSPLPAAFAHSAAHDAPPVECETDPRRISNSSPTRRPHHLKARKQSCLPGGRRRWGQPRQSRRALGQAVRAMQFPAFPASPQFHDWKNGEGEAMEEKESAQTPASLFHLARPDPSAQHRHHHHDLLQYRFLNYAREAPPSDDHGLFQ